MSVRMYSVKYRCANRNGELDDNQDYTNSQIAEMHIKKHQMMSAMFQFMNPVLS
jgi:Tfp pilus assembly protein PilF